MFLVRSLKKFISLKSSSTYLSVNLVRGLIYLVTIIGYKLHKYFNLHFFCHQHFFMF